MSEILWSDKMLLYSLSNWEIGGPTKEPPLDMQQDSRASRLPVNGLAHFGENRIQRAGLDTCCCITLAATMRMYFVCVSIHTAVGFYLHVCQRSCGLRALPLTQNSDR